MGEPQGRLQASVLILEFLSEVQERDSSLEGFTGPAACRLSYSEGDHNSTHSQGCYEMVFVKGLVTELGTVGLT